MPRGRHRIIGHCLMSFEPTQGPNQSPRASITQDKLATQKSAGQKCCLLLPVQEDPSVGGPHFLLLNVRQWGRSGAKCGASHPQLKVSLIAGDVRPELFGKKKKLFSQSNTNACFLLFIGPQHQSRDFGFFFLGLNEADWSDRVT